MGVIFRRLGFGVLSALAVLLALRKPPAVVHEGASANLETRERGLSVQLANARLHWSALDQRDSVLASNRSALITLSGFPAGTSLAKADSSYILDLIDRARRDSGVLLRIHFYNPDSYVKHGWGLYSGSLISPGEPTVCTAVEPVEGLPSGRIVVGKQGLVSVLSPCLLVGTFGMPGRTIGSWLNALRYAPAKSGKWLIPSLVDWDSGPWGWLRVLPVGTSGSLGSALSHLLGLEQVVQLLAPPYYFGQVGVQCLSGIRASCAKGVLEPGIIAKETEGLPRDLTLSPSLIRSSSISLFTPRPPGATFLSDLIREKGQEKFLRFWKSELPLERAFENAFQERLADWTSGWAKQRWLESWDARFRSEDVLLGVTLRTSWIPLSLGWSFLAIGAAGWAARRRQVAG